MNPIINRCVSCESTYKVVNGFCEACYLEAVEATRLFKLKEA